jgi:GNAT superfamily N-acetyltransferase
MSAIANLPLTFHTACPKSAAQILHLIQEFVTSQTSTWQPTVTLEQLKTHMAGPRPKLNAVLAELDGETVGFATYFFVFRSFTGQAGLYVEDLFVRPVHRGKGIGRALLTYLAQFARAEGCTRMEWSVHNRNDAAKTFYTHLGAEPMDWSTTYRLNDDAFHALANGGSDSPPPVFDQPDDSPTD